MPALVATLNRNDAAAFAAAATHSKEGHR